MNLTKVQIGALTFTIEEVEHLYSEREGGLMQPLLGRIQFSDQKISLLEDQGAESKQVALMHEILHEIWRQAALDNEQDEEQIISALAFGVVAVLKANPRLAGQLTDNDEDE